MKRTGWIKTIGLGFVAIALSADAATEETLKKAFSAASGGKLLLDVNGGSIEVKGADRKDVQVEVYRKATTRGFFGGNEEKERAELEANKITFAQEGSQITITTRRNKDTRPNRDVNLNSRYTILIPREFAADLKTSGGAIRVDQLQGNLKAHTSGGSLKLNQIKGPIDAHTSGGSIELAGSDGQAVVKTSGGSIKVREHKGDVQARTSGGAIDVDSVEGNLQASTSGGSVSAVLAKGPTGDCRLETSGGGITLRLPESAAVDLDAKTSAGSVSSELPVKFAGEKKRSSLKGPINDGGKSVYLRTSGGSIQVKKI